MRVIKNRTQISTPIIIVCRNSAGVGIGTSTSVTLGQVVKYIPRPDAFDKITIELKGKEYNWYLQHRFRQPYKNELKLIPE